MIKIFCLSNVILIFNNVNSSSLASKPKVMQELLYFFCTISTLLWLINHFFPISHFQGLKGLLTIIN